MGASIIATTSAGCLTFLNPSTRESKWRNIKTLCSILKLEIHEAHAVIYNPNSSKEEKLSKITELNLKLKTFEGKFRDILSSGS